MRIPAKHVPSVSTLKKATARRKALFSDLGSGAVFCVAQLMIENSFGVSVKEVFEVKQVDTDYFIEE